MSLENIVMFVLFLMAVRVFRDLLKLYLNLTWQRNYRYQDDIKAENFFVLCVPMYREQAIIEETIQYFASLNYPKDKYQILIATTAKEDLDGIAPTTKSLAEKCAVRANASFPGLVKVVHYPSYDGVMAHQINYAAQSIKNVLIKDNVYFSVYNADSRPNPNTLHAVDAMIENKIAEGRRPMVLQQSSLFTTKKTIIPTVGYWMTAGAAIHQSLWSLRHEISFYRKQSRQVYFLNKTKSMFKILRFSRIAHCVGHGLYISGSHFLVNPLPEKLLNEDLPYGLLQCCQRHAIHPVPLLEVGLSPVRPIELYRQKSVWFNPFFEFSGYAKAILKNYTYVSRFEVWFLTLQAYSSLFIWLVHSLTWVGSLILTAICGLQYVVAWILLFILYWVIPVLYYRRFLSTMKLDIEVEGRAIFWGSLYILSHSIGPWWGVCRWLKALSRGLRPSKPKTENI